MKKWLRSLLLCFILSLVVTFPSFADVVLTDDTGDYPIYTSDTFDEIYDWLDLRYEKIQSSYITGEGFYFIADGHYVLADPNNLLDNKLEDSKALVVRVKDSVVSVEVLKDIPWRALRHGTRVKGDITPSKSTCIVKFTTGVTTTDNYVDYTADYTQPPLEVEVVDRMHTGEDIVVQAKYVYSIYCWGDELFHDETNHWRVCQECGKECMKSSHSFINGECLICGYSQHTHSFTKHYYSDNGVENAYYIMECDCGEKETGDKVYTKFNIAFDLNGGIGTFNTVEVTAGSSYTLPTAVPVKDGCTFQGWSTSRSGTVEYTQGESVKPVASMTLYAIYQGKPVTVNLDGSGKVDNLPPITVYYNSLYGELPTLSLEGYTFSGWKLEDGTMITSTTVVSTTEEHTLYAVWNELLWDVTFVSSDKVETVKVMDQSVVVPPYEVTTAGLIFRHWSKTRTGTSYDFDTPVTESFTLYAVCDGIDVNIYAGSMVFKRKYPDLIGDLVDLPETGKKFLGWAYDAEGTQMVSSTDTVPPYDLYLYPVYEDITYHITLTGVAMVDAYYNQAIPELPEPDAEGKNFMGWYYSDVKVTTGEPYRWNIDITCEPKYDIQKFTVKHPNGDIVTMEYGSIIGTIRDGVIPKGKQISHYVDQYGNIITAESAVYSNITITAVYVNFSVSLTLKDGDWSSSLSAESASIIDYLPTRSKPGYSFAGWSVYETGVADVTRGPFYKDTTLYARFKAEKQIIYLSDLNQNIECYTDSEIGSLPAPTKDGYDFEYWMYNGEKVSSDFVVPAGGATLVAKWTPVHIDTSTTVEVRFWSDGVKINTVDLNPGDILYDPGAPAQDTVDDRLFVGWSRSSSGGVYEFGKRIYSALDLYAVWQ